MNTGKYFFVPDWLLQENSQTIHAYIYILNEINNNGGEFKTSYRNIAKELNLSLQNIRTIIKTITQQSTHNITQQSTHTETLLSVDFISTIKDLKKTTNTVNNTQPTQQKTQKTTSRTPIKQRKETFVEDLKSFTHLYDKDMLNDFYRYWVETDQNEQKMRFELQKTWQLNLRLITWQRNAQKQFNAKTNPEKPKEEKIGRTSIETIKKNAEYNGQY
jgi:hypothetical protein